MFFIWLLLPFLQVSLLPNAKAASPPIAFPSLPITLSETANLTTANHDSILLANPNNEIKLFFADPGGPIPAAELRHTLFVARDQVQAYLPRYANEPISKSLFETNISFPETGDGVYLYVYAYGFGLSWLQLSHVLVILQGYMLGTGPGHPHAHCQQLEFYVQLTAGVEVATGVVEFKTAAGAVAKRNLVTTTLKLPHADLSLHSVRDPPIIFNIPKTNLDLNVTSLGLPIPEATFLATIELAFKDVILNHMDIDSPIPTDRPYSFIVLSGKSPHLFNTEIKINAVRGKRVSWGLLCILFYGLRDFVLELKHFNVLKFEVNDAKLGVVGHGEVLYWPAGETALTE